MPELLIVLGIILLLISLLIPTISRARQHASAIKCRAQLHSIGIALATYVGENDGRIFPRGLGKFVAPELRWPVLVLGSVRPPELICPVDSLPENGNSYLLNSNVDDRGIKFDGSGLVGISPTEVVVIGEKVPESDEYYMNGWTLDYWDDVDSYRHGPTLGSNYLYLDLHVSNEPPIPRQGGIDPWDVPPQL